MKKTIIIVLVIIILGAGGFYFFNKEAAAPTVFEQQAAPADGLVVKDSLFSWLKKGKGVECTINAEEGDITVYALGDKVRMEGVSMLPENNELESSTFLSDGDFIYIWNGKEGIKIDARGMNEPSGEETERGATQYSWENMAQEWDKAKVKYDCQEKKLSGNLFMAPDDVAFVDMAGMMGAAGIEGAGGTDDLNEAEGKDDQDNQGDIDMDKIKEIMEDMENIETE